MKIAIIETKLTLPNNYRPRTLTYRSFSQIEKENEKVSIVKRAEETYLNHVLKQGAKLMLDRLDVKIRSTVKVYHIHSYIPTDSQLPEYTQTKE
jgi:hypothetical protein